MKSRASLSRAERAPRAWYRERWPWLLIAGPAVVVVASLASAWLAIASDDGLVAQDYYKQGLLINRKLRAAGSDVEAARLGATVTLHANGEVRAHLVGLPPAPAEAPAHLRLTLAHPGHTGPQAIVALTRVADGEYVGEFSEPAVGRLVVTLESDSWRLPTTTVRDGVVPIELGAVAGHS
jgi:hypothetical protein